MLRAAKGHLSELLLGNYIQVPVVYGQVQVSTLTNKYAWARIRSSSRYYGRIV